MKRFVLGLMLLVTGCSATGTQPAAEPTITTRPPTAEDPPDHEPQPEGVQPTTGPLAEMAQALEEAERESERAAEFEAELTRAKKHAVELQAAFAKTVGGRKALEDELEAMKAELHQTLARLVDAEMARVRAEQELLRRDIETEERARQRREETSNG